VVYSGYFTEEGKCRVSDQSQFTVKTSSNIKDNIAALRGEGGSWSPTGSDTKPQYKVTLNPALTSCGIVSFSMDITNANKVVTSLKTIDEAVGLLTPTDATVRIVLLTLPN
jgi:hypothetical protein